MPAAIDKSVIEEICFRLAEGEDLLTICETEGMPSRRTVTRWQIEDAEIGSRIARAREFGQDASIDECRRILKNATPETAMMARNEVWHRQWEASKRAGKRFGDRMDLNHSGEVSVTLSERLARAREASPISE